MKRIAVILSAICFILSAALSANAQMSFGKLPSYFEQNRGQASTDVKFLSRGFGYTLLLRDHDAALYLGAESLRIKLVGGHASRRVAGESILGGTTSYLFGNARKTSKTNFHEFGQ